MTFIVTFLIAVSILIIRSFWKAYKEPAAILGRQAANMNWVAVGQVKDSDGFSNVRYVRDGMEAEVSFQEGNVSLVRPVNDTFNDFEELEQSLANLNEVYEDLYEEAKNDLESWDEDEDEDFDDRLEDETYEDYFGRAFHQEFRRFSRSIDDRESFYAIEELMETNEDLDDKVNELFLAGFEAKIDESELAAMFFSTVKKSIIPKDGKDVNLTKGLEEINSLIVWINNNTNN